MRRAALALVFLSACAPAEDDAAGMSGNGLLGLIHDDSSVAIPGSENGLLSVDGHLFTIAEVDVLSNGVMIDGNGISVTGVFGPTIDLTERVAMTGLSVNPGLLGGDMGGQGADYVLGPAGGTIWLTRIETQQSGYRVRGQFDGQICPEPAATSDCHRIEGVFAFDAVDLPPNAITGNLVIPAS